MRVRLVFFAVLRDLVGQGEMDLDVEPGTRAVDVWGMLRSRHEGLRAHEKPPMTAINESYAPAETELKEGDELVFVPPVAGG